MAAGNKHSRFDQFTDEELVLTYRQNDDREAVGILFQRYLELVQGTCLKYLRNVHDAEDASMAVFEALMVKLKKHEVDYFRGWLYVLVKNHCLQILRKSKRDLTKDLDGRVMHSDDELHPDDVTLIKLRENGLHDCISRLPAEQKQSIELFYFESRSYQEIADIMSVDKKRIRSYIQNGRRNLKMCMNRYEEKRFS